MIRQRVALPALSEWALSAPTRKPGSVDLPVRRSCG